MTPRAPTPSQTVGPFFHDCLLREGARCDATGAVTDAAAIRVEGRVTDGDGLGVPDAVLEVWQREGFARIGTDADGRFAFVAVRPEPTPFDDASMQAPHLSIAVFARGLLNHLFTRVYFEDETGTERDPVLRHVPEARRRTLIARRWRDGSLTRQYRFDIILQGENETVFFDFRRPRS